MKTEIDSNRVIFFKKKKVQMFFEKACIIVRSCKPKGQI